MSKSSIIIDVTLDEKRVPEQIQWKASESTADSTRIARGMMLSFWDGSDKSALRIDLWTKDMPVDEMKRFFYETLQTMGDSFLRATGETNIVEDLRDYCAHFTDKMELSQNK